MEQFDVGVDVVDVVVQDDFWVSRQEWKEKGPAECLKKLEAGIH
jgi:hypothetical protein